MQSSVLIVSNIILFQSSPVETLNSISIAWPKFLKFIVSSITSPLVISLKKKTPRIENMNKMSINNEKTFIREGKEKVMVEIRACSPSYFPINLNILETLSTLRTLASYGPTLRNLIWFASKKESMTSNKEDITTTKSNLFHVFLK